MLNTTRNKGCEFTLVLQTVSTDKGIPALNDYVENIENDVSEIKFFLSQIYKAFTIYKDKKEEFKAEAQKLNDVIEELKERETKYKLEIENLNKTIQSILNKEKNHTDQIKLLEKKLIENTEKVIAVPKSRKNPQQTTSNVAQMNSPNIFYEKRPYYNELNVSKVIDPFRNLRAFNQ
jgi:chromosome segregation ATPase